MAQHPKAKARNKQQTAMALVRRRQVAQLRLAGYRDVDQIGQQLGVSGRTIRRDFDWLDEQYRQQAARDIAAYKGKALERIEDAIKGIWPDVIQGRWRASTVLIGLLDREAKLLGLDAPAKIKVDIEAEIRTIAEDEGIDPDELVRVANQIIREG